MTAPIAIVLVVAENGLSHEHHHRLASTDTIDGAIDDLVRAAVGGWLENIPITDPTLAVWCDEEGRLRHRDLNPVGSRLVYLLGGRAARYVGPIVITGQRQATLNGLTEQQLEQLRGLLQLCRS
jgi:hypothetical protein